MRKNTANIGTGETGGQKREKWHILIGNNWNMRLDGNESHVESDYSISFLFIVSYFHMVLSCLLIIVITLISFLTFSFESESVGNEKKCNEKVFRDVTKQMKNIMRFDFISSTQRSRIRFEWSSQSLHVLLVVTFSWILTSCFLQVKSSCVLS